MRKSIAAGTLALASLAGIGAGVTLSFPGISNAATAVTTTDSSTTDPSTTATPAARPDRGAIVTDTLAKLVSAGTITQSQADAVATALQQAMPARGGGPGGEGRPGDEAGMRGGGHLEVAATALGMTADELRTELQAGKSIAQVAEAKGVSVDAVKAALKTDLQTRLAQQVTDGKITQAQADERLAAADTHVQAEVDQVGMPAGKGGRGGHGPRGEAPAAAAAPAASSADAGTTTSA